MFYHAYKLNLSDEIVDAVNSEGSWDAVPEGSAYMRLSFAKQDDEQLPMKVMCAALMGLYQHGLTVLADSLDDVFEYDNAPCPVEGVDPVYHCRGLRSLSVGDVVRGVSLEKKSLHVCCSFGWVELPEDVAQAFSVMAQRIDYQRPNALLEAA